MREFKGNIAAKVEKPHPSDEAAAVFDAEVYLNGEVASEVFKRYGVSIRVHLQESEAKK